MMFNKKAQEGGGAAAILVALIALFILVYLMFVPPSVRLDILQGAGDSTETETEATPGGSVLLLETPGSIAEEGTTSMSHSIPSVNLYLKKEGKILESIGGVAVARSDFSSAPKTIPFYLADVQNTENVLLSFNAITSEGNLIIRLNGEEIFNKYVAGSVEPLTIRKSLLKDSNLIEFDVTGPGWMFWSKNDYELANVELRGDVSDVAHKAASTTFYVDSEEKSTLRRGELYFYPYCTANSDSLTIKLNGAEVFTGVPQCGYINKFEVSPEQLMTGANTLDFSIKKGSYTVTRVRFDSELKNKRNKIYHFEVSEKQFSNLSKGYSAYLQLKFAEDYKNRQGRIYVNNNIKSFDIDEPVYQIKINDFLKEGYNTVKLSPEGSYEVDELKIWLKK